MTRADTYDDLARLEQLLDEHAQMPALDPAKLPAIRAQVWELLVDAEIHRDLELGDAPPDERRRSTTWSCTSTATCARSRTPRSAAACTCSAGRRRARRWSTSCWPSPACRRAAVPSLRATVADRARHRPRRAPVAPTSTASRRECRDRGRSASPRPAGTRRSATTRRCAGSPTALVPALRRATDEIANLLAGLDGRYVPAGPSGAPTRGVAHVLPTGPQLLLRRPQGHPVAAGVGGRPRAGRRLIERHVAETGHAARRTVGLVLWGTAAMRTDGDDVAEALALLGVRPMWDDRSPAGHRPRGRSRWPSWAGPGST